MGLFITQTPDEYNPVNCVEWEFYSTIEGATIFYSICDENGIVLVQEQQVKQKSDGIIFNRNKINFSRVLKGLFECPLPDANLTGIQPANEWKQDVVLKLRETIVNQNCKIQQISTLEDGIYTIINSMLQAGQGNPFVDFLEPLFTLTDRPQCTDICIGQCDFLYICSQNVSEVVLLVKNTPIVLGNFQGGIYLGVGTEQLGLAPNVTNYSIIITSGGNVSAQIIYNFNVIECCTDCNDSEILFKEPRGGFSVVKGVIEDSTIVSTSEQICKHTGCTFDVAESLLGNKTSINPTAYRILNISKVLPSVSCNEHRRWIEMALMPTDKYIKRTIDSTIYWEKVILSSVNIKTYEYGESTKILFSLITQDFNV